MDTCYYQHNSFLRLNSTKKNKLPNFQDSKKPWHLFIKSSKSTSKKYILCRTQTKRNRNLRTSEIAQYTNNYKFAFEQTPHSHPHTDKLECKLYHKLNTKPTVCLSQVLGSANLVGDLSFEKIIFLMFYLKILNCFEKVQNIINLPRCLRHAHAWGEAMHTLFLYDSILFFLFPNHICTS